MKIQDCIDYDVTMKFIIEQGSHSILTDELFEQTDDAIKNILQPTDKEKGKLISARFKKIDKA